MHHAPTRLLHNLVNTPFPDVNQDVLVRQLHAIFPENYILFLLYLLFILFKEAFPLLMDSVILFLIFESTIINARKQVNIKYPKTGSVLEVDAWIPDYNIGFEFQVIIYNSPPPSPNFLIFPVRFFIFFLCSQFPYKNNNYNRIITTIFQLGIHMIHKLRSTTEMIS